MKRLGGPTLNPKALVARGYDRCGDAYAAARAQGVPPALEDVLSRLPPGGAVLDIGCGAGRPAAAVLADRFAVTGVDISAAQVRRARRNVPGARFVHADIMGLAFAPAAFDAVLAIYVLFHLPRDEHGELLRRIHDWLKPGGWLAVTVAAEAEAGCTEDDFFGTRMYWSHFGRAQYEALLDTLGFDRLGSVPLGHGYADAEAPAERHPLLIARKPADAGSHAG